MDLSKLGGLHVGVSVHWMKEERNMGWSIELYLGELLVGLCYRDRDGEQFGRSGSGCALVEDSKVTCLLRGSPAIVLRLWPAVSTSLAQLAEALTVYSSKFVLWRGRAYIDRGWILVTAPRSEQRAVLPCCVGCFTRSG